MTEKKPNEKQGPVDMIQNLSFCVFDLETTGGNHKSDKIIEIGLIKIENLKVVDQKDYLIKPEIRIPEFIQKLTNIKEEDVINSPLIEDVIDEVLAFMGDSILVAHNTSFDVPFLNSVLRRLKRPELENRSLCTNLMTKYLIPNLLNTNLNYMSRIFSIKHHKAHRALDDAQASAELLLKYLDIFIDKKIQKINHLYYPRNRYELDRNHFKIGINSNEDIIAHLDRIKSPYLATLKGKNGVIQFALPCLRRNAEKELITEKIKELEWETVTFKLFGSFIEALVHFNGLYSKMDSNTRNHVISFLWSTHLKKSRPSPITSDQTHNNLLDRDFGDFVITQHLVPEQMVIYPIKSLTLKSQLVFRYPGHQKKLLQFINSKSSRITNYKLKEAYYHPQLKEFFEHYLLENKNDESKDLFIFKKSLPLHKSEQFYKMVQNFLAQNPYTYSYPQNYI